MKILQINCVFPLGSTGKIVNDIHNELMKNGYESVVCYGNGPIINDKNIYKISNIFLQKINALISRISGYIYGGCFFATKKIINIIKKEKPDVVHLHCLNGHIVNIYKLLEWLKINNIKTVLTLHAEFMYTANCGYALECEKWKKGCGNCPRLKKETKSMFLDRTHESWKKMYNAFKDFSNLTIVSVSPWLMNRAKESPMLMDKRHITILNGIDTNIFKHYETDDLKNNMGLESKKIIFHATANFSDDVNNIKGGYYVLELAKMLEDENVQILVAGEYKHNIKLPRNITLLGKIQDQELLAKYYSMADVTLLTSKKETFSMVTAESLCCGTPVIGFKAGAPEQIAIKEYSSFVEHGNMDELCKEVLKFLNIKKSIKLEKRVKDKYSKESMINRYIEIYKEY